MKTRIGYDEALALTLEQARTPRTETIALADALGRVLADNFHAPFDLPGFANSAMDGYAVRAEDLPLAASEGLIMLPAILAGDTDMHRLPAAAAIPIMTGAPMPLGADAVIIQELAQIQGQRVLLPATTAPGANVRAADDDCRKGSLLLPAGCSLSAAQLAVLAGFGLRSIQVGSRVRVAIVTTGDELRAAGAPLQHGLRYDSNGILLAGLARQAGADVVSVEHQPDDSQGLQACLQRLAGISDVLLVSGGASVGAADHMPDAIEQLGELVYWKLRMKPGMPVLLARIPSDVSGPATDRDLAGATLVFGLPGNPVSAGVCFHVLVRPLLDAMHGSNSHAMALMPARLTGRWAKTHARLEFLRVSLDLDSEGRLLATPFSHQGSGALTQLARADGLARLEEGERDYPAGCRIGVLGLGPFPIRQPTGTDPMRDQEMEQ